MKCDGSTPNPPQLTQLIQSRFHPFDSSRIGLWPTVPAQCLADLLERNFAAHRPFQHDASCRLPPPPIGARTMRGAVRLVAKRLRSAEEEEARGPRIADRPAAGFIVQFEQRAALVARDARVGADSLDIGPRIDDPGRQRAFPEPPGGALCVYGPIGGTRG